jgi:hypothetical protein
VDVVLTAGQEVEGVKAALQDILYTGYQLAEREERRFFIRHRLTWTTSGESNLTSPTECLSV